MSKSTIRSKVSGRSLLWAVVLSVVLGACSSESTPDDGASTTSLGTESSGSTGVEGDTSTTASVSTTEGTGSASSDASVTILVSTLDATAFHPYLIGGAPPYPEAVLATLVGTDGKGNLAPGIAESWSLSDDGLTWTFNIRDDVTFHNGESLTAEDVAFSLNDTYGPAAIENSTVNAYITLAENTESITATGPYTVEVRHLTPVPGFASTVSSMDNNYGGAIIPKAYFEEVGSDGFNAAPIGAGPFRVLSVEPGSSITMERYDDYYDQEHLPQFKNLVWNAVPEGAARVQALRAGQADIIATDPSQTSQIEDAGGSMVYSPEGAYVWTGLYGCWDEQYPCFDQNVRLALDLALDKSTLMSSLYGDSWQNVGWAFVSPSSLGYSEDLAPRAVDLDQASSLLAEAGYPDGEGFPELVIHTSDNPAVPLLPELGQLMAASWRDGLGIDASVVIGEASSVRADLVEGRLNGAVYLASNQGRYDATSVIIANYGNLESGSKETEDPEIIAASQAAVAVIDPEEREQAYNAHFKTLQDATYEIATGSLALTWGTSDRISGWEPAPMDARVNSFWTIQVSD